MKKHIFLYGPPGSGKSTVGRALAQRLDLPFLDLDAEIERAAGRIIPQIMAEDGEAAFRNLESIVLERAVASPSAVIALGGGALLRPSNRLCAESHGEVVLLEADLPTLLERLRQDENQRPLLAGDLEAKLVALLERRAEHYASFDLRVANTTQTKLEKLTQEIQNRLGRFRVQGMGEGYKVLIRPGASDDLGPWLRELGFSGYLALVSDSIVAPLYGERILNSVRQAGYQIETFTIPAGEQHKRLRTVNDLWRSFLRAGLDRKSMVIALGGGVVGDLVGFAAATYMRGIAWVNVPTSLLAMVDASLGGKTGFDLAEGKNLVGAFHPPRLVLADVEVLATLPEAELRSGLAEVVKHGIIADEHLFDLCAGGYRSVWNHMDEIVRRAMAVKIHIIEADPFEQGERAALNLGHTVGHAIEAASNYRLRHGEAVAIGLVTEARLAERLGLAEDGLASRISETLSGLGLPVEIPAQLSPRTILRAMRFDKKKVTGVVHFALPIHIGAVRVGVAVQDLEQILEA